MNIARYPSANEMPESEPPFVAKPDAKVSTTIKVMGALLVAGVAAGIYGENLRGKLERLDERSATMERRQGSVETKVDGLRDDLRDMAYEQKTYLKYLVNPKGPKPVDESAGK